MNKTSVKLENIQAGLINKLMNNQNKSLSFVVKEFIEEELKFKKIYKPK